jgi:hypothetical protein
VTVVLASPWGTYPQGAHGGNPAETHLWSVTPRDFEAFGYQTRTDGAADVPGSEIVAWKMVG